MEFFRASSRSSFIFFFVGKIRVVTTTMTTRCSFVRRLRALQINRKINSRSFLQLLKRSMSHSWIHRASSAPFFLRLFRRPRRLLLRGERAAPSGLVERPEYCYNSRNRTVYATGHWKIVKTVEPYAHLVIHLPCVSQISRCTSLNQTRIHAIVSSYTASRGWRDCFYTVLLSIERRLEDL